ncbi:hypothetical protein RBH29_01205 [Herbivorax sp. ANBcel31]|uniref:hypothetical protein n=1 Tax=Herbivorax sp. ANBcel31 TaxID=3069754 RepID=UPI0027B1AE19|nr:hypothetical protein [Herbivorax sp. ANBcel31]MDQ2085055.1 hypothetical protein [Herbivorax sp. ANBcel31]
MLYNKEINPEQLYWIVKYKPDVASIIEHLWWVIEELESVAEIAKDSIEERIITINDLEEKVNESIEEALGVHSKTRIC